MSDEAVIDLLESAPFSFVGTVEHLEAATMDVPVNDKTAVVYVDRVLHGPETMLGLGGQRITVQLLEDRDPPDVGETAAFFVQTLAFGASVAVAEAGRLCVADVEPYMRSAADTGERAFAALERRLEHKKLRKHAAEADALVLASVVQLEKVPVPPDKAPSEHDPEWWVATLFVHHVERGDPGQGPVRVLYANSSDIRWRGAPKPQAGERGLWLLHRTRGESEHWAPFQVLDAQDRQPVQGLDVIRQY